MSFGHHSVDVEAFNEEAVRHIVRCKSERNRLTFLNCNFRRSKRESVRMNFDPARGGLGERAHRKQERDKQTQTSSDTVFHFYLSSEVQVCVLRVFNNRQIEGRILLSEQMRQY
jgi:hypothetical protein